MIFINMCLSIFMFPVCFSRLLFTLREHCKTPCPRQNVDMYKHCISVCLNKLKYKGEGKDFAYVLLTSVAIRLELFWKNFVSDFSKSSAFIHLLEEVLHPHRVNIHYHNVLIFVRFQYLNENSSDFKVFTHFFEVSFLWQRGVHPTRVVRVGLCNFI